MDSTYPEMPHWALCCYRVLADAWHFSLEEIHNTASAGGVGPHPKTRSRAMTTPDTESSLANVGSDSSHSVRSAIVVCPDQHRFQMGHSATRVSVSDGGDAGGR